MKRPEHYPPIKLIAGGQEIEFYSVIVQNNIPYKEVNVEHDPIAMQKLIQTTGQLGVPQTEVNGQWVIGFNPGAIMAALEQ